MTGRINLNQLRERCYSGGYDEVDAEVMLALIDAVQAAHAIQDDLDRHGYSSAEADQLLRDKLACFDFA